MKKLFLARKHAELTGKNMQIFLWDGSGDDAKPLPPNIKNIFKNPPQTLA